MKQKYRKSLHTPGNSTALLLLSFLVLLTPLAVASPTDEMVPESKQSTTAPDDAVFDKAFALVYSHPDSSQIIIYEALDTMPAPFPDINKMPLFNLLGISYLFQSNYSESLNYFFKSLELATHLSLDKHIAHAFNNTGVLYISTGSLKDALDYLLQANSIYLQLQDTVNYASTYNNIGLIYLDINNMDKAKMYFDTALEGFRAHDHQIGVSSVYNHIGKYYAKYSKPDSAVSYFNKAISIGQALDNYFNLTDFYREKANLLKSLHTYEEAIHYYEKSDSVANIISLKEGNAKANLGISRAWLALDMPDRALDYAEKAREIASSIQNKKLIYKANEVLSDIFTQSGEYKRALHYHQLAGGQKDLLEEQMQLYQIYNLEIEQLNREKDIQRLQIQEQEMKIMARNNAFYMTIVIFIALLISLSLVYFIYWQKGRHNQRNKIYEEKIKSSERLTKAVLDAEIQERKRIGRELHDGLGPLLSLVKIGITNVIDDTKMPETQRRSLLQHTVGNTEELLKEIKYISHNLSPPSLSDKGFEFAVKDLIARMQSTNTCKVSLNMNGLDGKLDKYVEHALFRTIQEVMNNTIKHADASEINIEILQSIDDITVMIEDNGVGFDSLALDHSDGLGLRSAASRIEGLNGSFFVDSKIDRGTIVTVIMPINQYATQ